VAECANQNTGGTDCEPRLTQVAQVPAGPGGGGASLEAALCWRLGEETREHLAEINRHILSEPGFGEVRS
jgi:hypothetical protein